MQPILEARNLCFAYGKKDVIRDVSIEVGKGEFVGIIGPNGSGKTTLLRLLNGILKPQKGCVLFEGQNLSAFKRKDLAKHMAMVPQNIESTFTFTAGQMVLMGRYAHLEHALFERGFDLQIAREAMQRTDTLPFAQRLFSELSGGERQRVIIASALAQEPKLLFLDEPTANLDIKYQREIFEILNQLNREENLTVITAMHDLNLAALFCNRLVMIKHGQVVCDGHPAHVLKEELLSEVYETEVQTFQTDGNGGVLILPRMYP